MEDRKLLKRERLFMKPQLFKLKAIVIIALLMVLSINVYGSGLMENQPWTLTQPDGTIIHVRFTGDSFNSRTHNEENFTMIRDPETRYWCWARRSDDGHNIESTGKPAHLYDPRELGLEPGIEISGALHLRNAWIMQYGVAIDIEDIEKGVGPWHILPEYYFINESKRRSIERERERRLERERERNTEGSMRNVPSGWFC